MLRVKLDDDELARLKSTAEARGWTVSQFVRDLIRQLPITTAIGGTSSTSEGE
jgi:hypothetical protein